MAAHHRCLANVEQQNQQPAQRSGVWPCWHSQLALGTYTKDWSLLTALAAANNRQSGLYLATLAALLLWGVTSLKQR
jgi:hypothetical protein